MTYMTATVANAAANAVLTPSTNYNLTLHTGSPSNTGANEVTGGGYAEQTIQMGNPSSGVQSSSTAETFTNMPSCTISYFGFKNGSTWLTGGALTSSLTIPSGATVSAAIGAITSGVQG